MLTILSSVLFMGTSLWLMVLSLATIGVLLEDKSINFIPKKDIPAIIFYVVIPFVVWMASSVFIFGWV